MAWEWPGNGLGGGSQAHPQSIFTHFPKIYIKLYVNEVCRCGTGLKMCFWAVSLLLKSWAGIGLGPFFPLCDQGINNLTVFFINHNMEEDIQGLLKIEKRVQERATKE